MLCNICYEEYPTSECEIYKPLCCDQVICDDCFIDWTKQQFSQPGDLMQWKCPCDLKDPLAPEKLILKIQGQQDILKQQQIKVIDLINDFALKHWMRRNDDMRSCPTAGCDFAGFIPRDDLKSCALPLKCLSCDGEWIDQL